eukprot:2755114-Alexandrium_andersonii.AAC.1
MKRLRRARRPVSSAESASAQESGAERNYPSGASGTKLEAVSGPRQFKLQTPQAISHVLGSESSEEL